MSCEFCRDNFTAYLEGELKGAQAKRFDAHLKACSECARDLESFRAAVGAMRALPQVQPPADLLARIDAALDATPAPVPSTVPGWLRGWSWQHAGGFALAACLLVTFVAVLRTGYLSSGGVPQAAPPAVATVPDKANPAPAAVDRTVQPPIEAAGPSAPKAADAMASARPTPVRAVDAAPRPSALSHFAGVRRAMGTRTATTPPAPVGGAADVAPSAPGVPAKPERASAPATPAPAPFMATKGLMPEVMGARGPSAVPETATLAADAGPQPTGGAMEAVGVPPSDDVIRVDFVPPRTRQVGEIGVAALVMQPSRPIRHAEVRVKPSSDVQITNASDGGLIFRGELPANRRTTVAVRMEPLQPGAHDMRIELQTDVPAASTALDVHIAGFKPAPPAPAPQTANARRDVNLVLSQTEIRSALRQVGEKAGVRVDMDPTVGGQHVDYSFHDVPAEAALRVLADEGGYRVAPDDGGWRVTKP